ncbi:MAG: TIGR03013 family XrtA/PEP-CTERM system glycosyltransferase [Terriglobia bacterium]
MVRLFNVYYPVRTLVLVLGELLIVCASFVGAAMIRLGPDSVTALDYDGGFYKVLLIAGVALLCFYYFDLYDHRRAPPDGEIFFRVLVVLGVLAFILAAIGFFFPDFLIGGGVFLVGLVILTIALLGWRWVYSWLIAQPFLRERVYVLGAGEKAKRLVAAIRSRPNLGLEVVGWTGAAGNGSITREELGANLATLQQKRSVDRVIVAMNDARGKMPVNELLDLRMTGVVVEDAMTLIERITGKIDVYELQPSWLIFSDGFRIKAPKRVMKRIISVAISFGVLIVCLPLLIVIAVAIRLDSEGPVFFHQERVGKDGKIFRLVKFRSMRHGSDSDGISRPAEKDDDRFTRVGRWLRRLHLDELPQLYNIFKGDMYFVGPRPFVPDQEKECVEKIPFYHQRWRVKPGATGWAQINRGYNATIEENAEKLGYDLYYIKNMSIGLDLMIVFHTVKTMLLGRGGR